MSTFVLAVLVAGSLLLGGWSSGAARGESLQLADISGDPNEPRRHFRERNPAKLTAAEAQAIYDDLAASLAKGYARSGHPVAEAYLNWRRANSAPYLSVTHGNSYLNNYVNETGAAYLRFEEAGRLPVGTVIAKPSFVATRNGDIRPGPLFIMEKMPTGFKYVTDDWRYTMIMPDGVLFGETDGEDSERVEYCIGCHLAREQYDHLYFVPKKFRAADE